MLIRTVLPKCAERLCAVDACATALRSGARTSRPLANLWIDYEDSFEPRNPEAIERTHQLLLRSTPEKEFTALFIRERTINGSASSPLSRLGEKFCRNALHKQWLRRVERYLPGKWCTELAHRETRAQHPVAHGARFRVLGNTAGRKAKKIRGDRRGETATIPRKLQLARRNFMN